MSETRQIILQQQNEERFNRKHIDEKIRYELVGNEDTRNKMSDGVMRLNQWIGGNYYQSKMMRLAQLKDMDLNALVMEIFVGIAYCRRAELFTSVSSQLAGRLRWDDKTEAITTMAEILAVLCLTDAFDISKADKMASLMIESRIPLSDELLYFVENSAYLPPMVCKPKTVTSNYCSGYLTHADSLMLGKHNHHDGDLCLDAINIMNSVALRLNPEFLDAMQETPGYVFETLKQAEQWDGFKKHSIRFYRMMLMQGNRFYLTHKVDKRGRLYSCGYHINTQGAAYKKAMLELADPELVEGVPNV
jgi:hypothetical protein